MFYKMIENKCTQWHKSQHCTIKNLFEYSDDNKDRQLNELHNLGGVINGSKCNVI